MPPQLQVSEKQKAILQRIIRRATQPTEFGITGQNRTGGAQYGRRDTQIGRELRLSCANGQYLASSLAEAWEAC